MSGFGECLFGLFGCRWFDLVLHVFSNGCLFALIDAFAGDVGCAFACVGGLTRRCVLVWW